MNKLPANVEVHKLKKPKNWAYPVQTTELVNGLGVADLDYNVRIFYDNSPSKAVFSFLNIIWQISQPEPHFYIRVQVVPGEYRQFWNKLIVAEVLPVLKKWVHGRHPPKSEYATLLYHDRSWRPTLSAEVKVNSDVTLWEKEWARPKEDG